MAELDFISKFSGEEIDNILDKSLELLNKGYTFSISSGGSRRFYGQFSNSFCTALNVNETTGVITSSFAYLYDPSAVSFDRDQSSVSNDNKNKALGNIGIDFVRIPYSLLGTTLSADELLEDADFIAQLKTKLGIA